MKRSNWSWRWITTVAAFFYLLISTTGAVSNRRRHSNRDVKSNELMPGQYVDDLTGISHSQQQFVHEINDAVKGLFITSLFADRLNLHVLESRSPSTVRSVIQDELRVNRRTATGITTVEHLIERLASSLEDVTLGVPAMAEQQNSISLIMALMSYMDINDAQCRKSLARLLHVAILNHEPNFIGLVLLSGFSPTLHTVDPFTNTPTNESALAMGFRTHNIAVKRVLLQFQLLSEISDDERQTLVELDADGLFIKLLKADDAVAAAFGKNTEAAVKHARDALDLLPDQITFHNWMLRLFVSAAQYGEARQAFLALDQKFEGHRLWKQEMCLPGVLFGTVTATSEVEHPGLSATHRAAIDYALANRKQPLITSQFMQQPAPSTWYHTAPSNHVKPFWQWLSLPDVDVDESSNTWCAAMAIVLGNSAEAELTANTYLEFSRSRNEDSIRLAQTIVVQLEKMLGDQLFLFNNGLSALMSELVLMLHQAGNNDHTTHLAQYAFALSGNRTSRNLVATSLRALLTANAQNNPRDAYLFFRLHREVRQQRLELMPYNVPQVEKSFWMALYDSYPTNFQTLIEYEIDIFVRALEKLSSFAKTIDSQFFASAGFIRQYRELIKSAHSMPHRDYLISLVAREMDELQKAGVLPKRFHYGNTTHSLSEVIAALDDAKKSPLAAPPSWSIREIFAMLFTLRSAYSVGLIAVIFFRSFLLRVLDALSDAAFYSSGLTEPKGTMSGTLMFFYMRARLRQLGLIECVSISTPNCMIFIKHIPTHIRTSELPVDREKFPELPETIQLDAPMILKVAQTLKAKWFPTAHLQLSTGMCRKNGPYIRIKLDKLFYDYTARRFTTHPAIPLSEKFVRDFYEVLLINSKELNRPKKAIERTEQEIEKLERERAAERERRLERERAEQVMRDELAARATSERRAAMKKSIKQSCSSFIEVHREFKKMNDIANSFRAEGVLLRELAADVIQKFNSATSITSFFSAISPEVDRYLRGLEQSTDAQSAEVELTDADLEQRQKDAIENLRLLNLLMTAAQEKFQKLLGQEAHLERAKNRGLEKIRYRPRQNESTTANNDDDDGDTPAVVTQSPAPRNAVRVRLRFVASVTNSVASVATPSDVIVIPARASSATSAAPVVNNFHRNVNRIITHIEKLQLGLSAQNIDSFYALNHLFALFNQQLQFLFVQRLGNQHYYRYFNTIRNAFRHRLNCFMYEPENSALLSELKKISKQLRMIRTTQINEADAQALSGFAAECEALLNAQTHAEMSDEEKQRAAIEKRRSLLALMTTSLNYLADKHEKYGHDLVQQIEYSEQLKESLCGCLAMLGKYQDELQSLGVSQEVRFFTEMRFMRKELRITALGRDQINNLRLGDALALCQDLRRVVGHEYNVVTVEVGTSVNDEIIESHTIANLTRRLVALMPKLERGSESHLNSTAKATSSTSAN